MKCKSFPNPSVVYSTRFFYVNTDREIIFFLMSASFDRDVCVPFVCPRKERNYGSIRMQLVVAAT